MSIEELNANLVDNCIPVSMLSATVFDYPDFLEERRQLMAEKVKTYFKSL